MAPSSDSTIDPEPEATAYCVYCDSNVPVGDRSDEHIWLDALGGDALPDLWRLDVCKRCNNMAGVYVDAAFIKSWVGQAERSSGAEDYLSPSAPEEAAVPYSFLGSISEDVGEGQVIDLWAGLCGAMVFHARAAPDDETVYKYAGGDPRRAGKRRTAGCVYLVMRSPEPFWQKVAIACLKHQFEKPAKVVLTRLDPSVATDLPYPDPSNAEQQAEIATIKGFLAAPKMESLIQVDPVVGGRFQAKVALALGYKLFGDPFAKTGYSRMLRGAFREKDVEKLRTSKVIGTSILGENALGAAAPYLRWPGGWLLWLRRQSNKVLLIVATPSGRTFTMMITDDAALAATLPEEYDEGLVWLVVPSIDQAVGPIWAPDYVAHQIREIENSALTALEARRHDRSLLPDCGLRPEQEAPTATAD